MGGRSNQTWIAEYAARPPKLNQSRLPYGWGSAHRRIHRADGGGDFFPRTLALRGHSVHLGMGTAIRRTRLRAQAAGILPRLALPAGRSAMVVGQNARQSLDGLRVRKSQLQTQLATFVGEIYFIFKSGSIAQFGN